MTTKKNVPFPGVCLFLVWTLFSCGLEDLPFIGHVPEPLSTLSGTMPLEGFLLPSFGAEYPFESFVIFYRIYLSTHAEGAEAVIDHVQRSNINPTLNTNFNAFATLAYHGGTAMPDTAGLDNRFQSAGFMRLALENADIDHVLGTGALGGRLRIDFSHVPGQPPQLVLDGVSHYLRRAEHSVHLGWFNPVPAIEGALPFLNHPELRRAEFTHGNEGNNAVNLDVVNRTGAGIDPYLVIHSYVLMYIAATGRSHHTVPPTRVFSQPTFLGIFRLPDHM